MEEGASTAQNDTLLRQSRFMLQASFSAWLSRTCPFRVITGRAQASLQFWLASWKSQVKIPSTGWGWGLYMKIGYSPSSAFASPSSKAKKALRLQ